jgi:hypothetical protein
MVPTKTILGNDDEHMLELLRGLKLSTSVIEGLLQRIDNDAEIVGLLRGQFTELAGRFNTIAPVLVQVAVLEERIKHLESGRIEQQKSLASRWQFWAAVLAALLGFFGTMAGLYANRGGGASP